MSDTANQTCGGQPPSRTEEELREREEQYRSIFESTTDGLAIVDQDGYVVEVNAEHCRLFGYTHDEMIGLHVAVLTHPSYHHLIAEGMETLTTRGGTFQREVLAVRKDGSAFHAESRGRLFTFKGQPHFLSVLRDVTERVHAEQALREQEERYRTIFEATSDGLIINDPTTGTVIEANPAVCQMHGFTYEEFIGLHATAFIHPDYHPVFAEFLEVISGGGTYRTHAVDLRKDGTPFHVEVHGSCIMYRGRPHILAVVRDITERIAAEEAVQEERHRLSRELHDSVSQALFSIALGTRTARTLLDREPARVAEALDFTLIQAERGLAEMRALIFELRPEALEREGLVNALQKHADAVRARHQIRVETALRDEPDVILPIKEGLYRIAQEAMHNTVKHAAASTITLSLRTEDGDVCLTIEDDGNGFDTSNPFPGHLGLQSMRERAVRFGGLLHIDSAPGAGTRISVAIPCRAAV